MQCSAEQRQKLGCAVRGGTELTRGGRGRMHVVGDHLEEPRALSVGWKSTLDQHGTAARQAIVML